MSNSVEIIKDNADIQNLDSKSSDMILDIASFISNTQLESGAIPWFSGHKLDPWDHCEAIMALSIAKRFDDAERGFIWLQNNQNNDGSWFSKYLGDEDDGDLDRYKQETNFIAYPATALWHYYLCSGQANDLKRYFPMIERAINFVIKQQSADGDIRWALSTEENLPADALVTGSSSTLRSIECAIRIAEAIGVSKPHWNQAYFKLANAIKEKPWRFDRTWESKARFSMDWFYPILSGIYSIDEARSRISDSEDKFIVTGIGCKCVSDEPWVTIAESCELVMALVAADRHQEAHTLFKQLHRWRDDDGAYWTGYQYETDCIWPKEKTTWTAAAVALAYDALFTLSPASDLFTTKSSIKADVKAPATFGV